VVLTVAPDVIAGRCRVSSPLEYRADLCADLAVALENADYVNLS